MATYTVTLTMQSPGLATYHTSSIQYSSGGIWTPSSIVPPTWNSGRKSFAGYTNESGATILIQPDGSLNPGMALIRDETWPEAWIFPASDLL